MKKTLLAVLVGLAMMAPSVAFANSSCQAYSGKTCPPTSSTTSTQAAPPTTGAPTTGATPTATPTPAAPGTPASTASATAASGTLPFTGLDLVALLAGGSVLLGAGLVVRRLSRDPD